MMKRRRVPVPIKRRKTQEGFQEDFKETSKKTSKKASKKTSENHVHIKKLVVKLEKHLENHVHIKKLVVKLEKLQKKDKKRNNYILNN